MPQFAKRCRRFEDIYFLAITEFMISLQENICDVLTIKRFFLLL